MKTPNYRLTEPVSLPSKGRVGDNDLQAGEFVRPIELVYVPKHVLDDERWKWFNKDTEVFCYTRKGVVPIPRYKIRES
jgi:hypothetical protein